MGKLCIIGFDDNKVIKDFVRLHAERLSGNKVFLNSQYPDFKEGERLIRRFYSRRPLRFRLARWLPYSIYHRLYLKNEHSRDTLLDALGGFCQHHDVDVILAEFGNCGATIAGLAKQLGIPLVVHFHGHDAHRQSILKPHVMDSYRRMFQSAHRILGVSRFMMSTLQEMGCPADTLIYNPYGPRESFYAIQPSYEPVILFVGRFTDIKANHLLIMAFRQALEKTPNARLVMIGEGELLETCKSLAAAWGIADRVDFPGSIPHQEVVKHFAHACCFAQHSVTPSYGDAEGTPNTILEAGAAALPVISTRHAGIPDVVIDGETGLLVDERDVDGMARCMVELLQDPERCRRMGQAARQHIQNNFNADQHIARLQAAIDSAREANSSL